MNHTLTALDPIKLSVATELARALSTFAGEKLAQKPEPDFVFSLLEKPPEAKLGDYAFPCFRFAKDLRMKPQDIATQIKLTLDSQPSALMAEVRPVGAFVNIFVNKSAMAELILKGVSTGEMFTKLQTIRAGYRERVMIEHSQLNTHKEVHVGHVRNIVLGDSLCRLYRYYGDDVVAANYPGDEGAHIAKTIWYMQKHKLSAPEVNRGEWLGQLYAKASQSLSESTGELKAQNDKDVSDVLRAIESKKGPTYELWRQTRQWSLDSFYEIFDFLGVHFDEYFFESEVSEESQAIVDEYLKRGLFVESDGAIGVDLSAYDLGFMLVRKRDGNTLYATKDLVLARRKFEQFCVQRSIYVVAAEQTLHFKQVFKTLELMGFEQAKHCFHLSYGLVRLPEGKMSSRGGKAATFRSLRESIEDELSTNLEKYKDQWTPEELQDTKEKLCIGAIKYGMLGSDPVKDIVYVASDWVSFEGDTGPYLMYSYARTKSILRKAAELGIVPGVGEAEKLVHESETDLVRYIYDFNEVVVAACMQFKPSVLAHHLFDMCRAFNRMYTQVSVLKAESKDLMQARANLLHAFSQTLAKGLGLLGVTPPEKM